jgi:hypothetical protein
LTVVHRVVREAVEEVSVRTAEVLDSSQEGVVRCILPGILRVVLVVPDQGEARVEVVLVLVVRVLVLVVRVLEWGQQEWSHLQPRLLVHNVERLQRDVDVRHTRRPKKVR